VVYDNAVLYFITKANIVKFSVHSLLHVYASLLFCIKMLIIISICKLCYFIINYFFDILCSSYSIVTTLELIYPEFDIINK
jgi:hypothetical protein